MRKIIVGTLIGIAGIFFIRGCLTAFSPAADSGASQSASASESNMRPEDATSVSAMKLYLDYKANEVQADNEYKNRPLLVRGLVTEISKDFMDNIVISLASTNEFEPVDAHLVSSDSSQAALLEKGTVVTLLCTGSGMVVGSPQLDDCSFQRQQSEQRSPVDGGAGEQQQSASDAQQTSQALSSEEPDSASNSQGAANNVAAGTISPTQPQQTPAPIARQTPAPIPQQAPAPIIRQSPDQTSQANQ